MRPMPNQELLALSSGELPFPAKLWLLAAVSNRRWVLNADGEPIESLYSIGNCAGNFFGHPDYPLTIPGLSLGRAHTQGYVVGRAVASK